MSRPRARPARRSRWPDPWPRRGSSGALERAPARAAGEAARHGAGVRLLHREVRRTARVVRAERVAVERVVGARSGLTRDLLGEFRAERALREDRAHVLAAHD